MIKVSDEFKEAWLQGHQKFIQLDFSDGTSLSDGDIVGESFKLEQTLCSEEQLVFGMVASSKLTVQVYNAGKRYSGLSVSPTLSAFEDGKYYMMPMGTYKIVEDKRSDDRNYRTLTAYDALYDVVGGNYAEWYNQFYIDLENSTGAGKCTLREFRDAFFAHLGIEQEDIVLMSDDAMTVGKNNVETFSGSGIIRCICEPNGAFGFINFDGKFQYVNTAMNAPLFPEPGLFPSPDIYPGGNDFEYVGSGDANSKPSSIVYEDFYTADITAAKWPETDRNPDITVGEEGNCYEFQDNFLFYEVTEDALRGLAATFVENAAPFWYVPSKVKMRARPWVQPGDLMAVNDGRDSVFFPVLNRTFSGVTATYDEFEAKGTEYYTYSANSLGRTIADYDHYNGTVEVRLHKNEDSITAEVTARKEADDEMSTLISQTAEGLTIEISKRTTSEQVQTLITASADEIRLKTGTLVWEARNSSLTESGDLTANDAFFNNVTLGGSVYFSVSGKNNKYFYLSAGSVDGDGNGIIFNKPNGSLAKVKLGALYCNRIVCDGGVVIDATQGNITAGKLIADNLIVDGMNIVRKINDIRDRLDNIASRIDSVKDWTRENFTKYSHRHPYSYHYWKSGERYDVDKNTGTAD